MRDNSVYLYTYTSRYKNIRFFCTDYKGVFGIIKPFVCMLEYMILKINIYANIKIKHLFIFKQTHFSHGLVTYV